MTDENKKGLWRCADCDYEGPEEGFKSRPDYRSCQKCHGVYVYSLDVGPAWNCENCGYEGAEIGFDEGLKCHVCPKCTAQDVFLDCDWQRMVDAESKAEREKAEEYKRDQYEDFDDD